MWLLVVVIDHARSPKLIPNNWYRSPQQVRYASTNYLIILKKRNCGKALYTLEENISKPWTVVGDSNQISWSTEKMGGAYSKVANMARFNHYIAESYLEDHELWALKLSWSNSGDGGTRIECKLNWALVNGSAFQVNHHKGVTEVPGLSDHSPPLFKNLQDSSDNLTSRLDVPVFFFFSRQFMQLGPLILSEDHHCLEWLQSWKG